MVRNINIIAESLTDANRRRSPDLDRSSAGTLQQNGLA